MNSVWLCVDAKAARPLRNSPQLVRSCSTGVQAPVLGIFMVDPAEIAQRIPRPLSPFVPVPESDGARSKSEGLAWPDPLGAGGYVSPPRETAFEFSNPRCSGVPCGMAIF
jgi:hypothetical protein